MEYSNLKMGDEESLNVALVTGATGLIGRQVCLQLAKQQWKIGLVVNHNLMEAEVLLQQVRDLGGDGVVIKANLLEPYTEVPRIVSILRGAFGPAYLLVHAASLPVKSSNFMDVPEDLDNMMRVHVISYLKLASCLLPDMLRVQSGILIGILTQAVLKPYIPGWHAYTIAKSALLQAINELSSRYEMAGIRSLAVMPGVLKTDKQQLVDSDGIISKILRQRWPLGLEANTVAQVICDVIRSEKIASGSIVNIDVKHGVQIGRSLLWKQDQIEQLDQKVDVEQNVSIDKKKYSAEDNVSVALSAIFTELFELQDQSKIESAEIGLTKGWDSLSHIKLIMEIESAFDIEFSSDEVGRLINFSNILQSIRAKLS